MNYSQVSRFNPLDTIAVWWGKTENFKNITKGLKVIYLFGGQKSTIIVFNYCFALPDLAYQILLLDICTSVSLLNVDYNFAMLGHIEISSNVQMSTGN